MLQKYIEILTRDEVIFRKKPDGTEVNYFRFCCKVLNLLSNKVE